jgi:hypothetical protein
MANVGCKLTTRFGTTIEAPDKADLHRVLKELFNEKIPGLTAADYAEHPSSWLTYSFESGPMYMLDVYRKGRVVFATYADKEDAEPAEEYELSRLAPEEIEQLWVWLCAGDITRVRSMPWRAL